MQESILHFQAQIYKWLIKVKSLKITRDKHLPHLSARLYKATLPWQAEMVKVESSSEDPFLSLKTGSDLGFLPRRFKVIFIIAGVKEMPI